MHQFRRRDRNQRRLQIVHLILQIAGAAPRRRQEYRVRTKLVRQLEEISRDELDPIGHAVHRGVVLGHFDLLRVDVDRNDLAAGEGELDRVATAAAEGIHNQVGPAAFGRVRGYLFRRHGEPAFPVQLDAGVEEREQREALVPVLQQGLVVGDLRRQTGDELRLALLLFLLLGGEL